MTNIKFRILPQTDTTNVNTFFTDTAYCNLDSFFLHDQYSNSYETKYLTHVYISLCTISVNNSKSNNNISNLLECDVEAYTSLNSALVKCSASNISYINSDSLIFTNFPTDNVIQYLYYNGIAANSILYNIKGKLKKPITDTLNCTISLSIDLHIDKSTRERIQYTPLK